MGLAAVAAYGAIDGVAVPPVLRYAAVLVFSGVGGLIPATLFALAVRLAPSEQTLSSTVGWMQQWSALGQFAGPPLVAWVASRSGGWQWTWVATGACSLFGLLLAARIGALLRCGPRRRDVRQSPLRALNQMQESGLAVRGALRTAHACH